jgi:uncharacterized membrane protein YeiH
MLEQLLFEILVAVGTIAFAMSGAFKAIRHEFDVLGLLVLGFATALGGGLIRDALLQRTPAAFIDNGPALYALAGCVIVIFSHWLSSKQLFGLTNPESRTFLVLDAIGLAAFTVVGASAGASAGLNAFGVVMLAAITGVGGGMIRDLFAGETPLVLKADLRDRHHHRRFRLLRPLPAVGRCDHDPGRHVRGHAAAAAAGHPV